MNLKEILSKMLIDTMVQIVYNGETSEILPAIQFYNDKRSKLFEVKNFSVVNGVIRISVK